MPLWTPSLEESEHIYAENFVHDVYFRHGIRLPYKPPRPPVVLDVGANVGLFTLRVRQECPNAVVFAVEPAPLCTQALYRNLALHDIPVLQSTRMNDQRGPRRVGERVGERRARHVEPDDVQIGARGAFVGERGGVRVLQVAVSDHPSDEVPLMVYPNMCGPFKTSPDCVFCTPSPANLLKQLYPQGQ